MSSYRPQMITFPFTKVCSIQNLNLPTCQNIDKLSAHDISAVSEENSNDMELTEFDGFDGPNR